jgi:ubiquinone/menaquinone biosynthesis C-methylase UbiE
MHGSHSFAPGPEAGAAPTCRVAAATLDWPLAVEREAETGRASPAPAAPVLPAYLVRHYWWAYLWAPAVWFFDHQPIINTIVFGQYRKLTEETLRLLDPARSGETLLVASAYGVLIPSLAERLEGNRLTVVDAADIQLRRARIKLEKAGVAERVRLERMVAESLEYADDSFDSTMMFLLLHELPPEARRQSLIEALRVLRPGGQMVLAEYGERTTTHWFHRFAPFRWIFGTAEPFLPSLWHEDLDALLASCAAEVGKRVVREERVSIFRGFYRVLRYRIEQA